MAEAEALPNERIEVPRYPWHDAPWRSLTARLDRLPHAVLFHGQPGLGKHALALRLANTLLCAQPATDTEACGSCKSCLLFAAGSHPDLLLVSPTEEGKPIVVDQVRGVIEFLSMRPHTARCQVVILSPAEAMNLNAANSLLKVLEEPTPESYFLLVAHQPTRLPVTVRSRCTRVVVKPPVSAEGLAWLRLQEGIREQALTGLLASTGGSPLLALAYARRGLAAQHEGLFRDLVDLAQGKADPVVCAAHWATLSIERVLDWLYGAVADLIKLRAGEPSLPSTASRLESTYLRDLINIFNINELFIFIDVISDVRRQFPGPLDPQLALEGLLAQWCRLAGTPSKIG